MSRSWIYVSPHLDDAVWSCGARIWQQRRAGELVRIWTLCAGDPPAGPLSPLASVLFGRASPNITSTRRDEDRDACACLGAELKHFALPDCIYRRHPDSGSVVYRHPASIQGARDRREEPIWRALWDELMRDVPGDAELVFPLAVGNHVDHQFTRWLAQQRDAPCWFYADVPYV